MDKHTEIIFNLFIMEFYRSPLLTIDSWSDEANYRMYDLKLNSDIFLSIKSCFPENEIACQSLVSGNYEIDFPCNLIYDKALTLKARKIAKYNKKTKNWEL